MPILFLLEPLNVTYSIAGTSGIKKTTKPHETETWCLVRSPLSEGMKVRTYN